MARYTASWLLPVAAFRGISRQPVPNLARLRVTRLDFQHFQVMLPRFGRLVKLLRVKVAECQGGAGFVRIAGYHPFQLDDGVGEVISLLEDQREIVASIERLRLDCQRVLISRQRSREIAGLGK